MAKTKQDDLDYADLDRAGERREQLTSRRAFRVPEGMQVMKTDTEEVFVFDHLPFRTKGNPMVEDGKLYHERTYFVHQGIGPDRKPVCCLRKNWDEPCPVCELQEKLRSKLDRNDKKGWEATSQLNAKDRQLFCVLNRMGARPRIMLYENSYAAYGEALQGKLDMGNDRNGYKRFLRLEGGKTINASFQKQSMGQGQGQWCKCTAIEMEDREEDIPLEILEKVPCLDELLIKLPYEDIKELLCGKDGEPEEGETPSRTTPASNYDLPMGNGKKPKGEPKNDEPGDDAPPAKKTKTPKDDRNPAERVGIKKGDFIWHEDHGRCEVIRVSGDGTALSLMDEKDEMHTGIDPSDCKTGDEAKEAYEASQKPEEKEPPAKKGRGNWPTDTPPPSKKK